MSDEKKINKIGMSAKTRIIVASVAILGVAGGVFAVWYHHHKQSEFQGSANVSSGPNIKSIPGAGNPSDQYVSTQNLQNNLQEKEARKHAGSSVPTITRPSFIGNPNAFGVLPSAKVGAATKPRACAIKKVIVMFRPNPANCAVQNLKMARKAGVTAEELACQGCSLQALKMAGYTAGELKNVGYSAKQLKAAGYSLGQLAAAGFSAKDLKNAGYNASKIANVGFTAGQLAAAGFTPGQLKKAGFTAAELAAADVKNPNCDIAKLTKARKAGVSAATLKKEGCGIAALKAAGYTAAQLKAAGFSAAALKKAGFTAAQLKAAGFTAAQLKNAGFSAAALKKAGYSAAQLKKAGFSAAALKNAGFSNAALKAAGYTAAQIKAADAASKVCNIAELKKEREAGVSAIELKKKGCGLAALKAAGYTAAELKTAGFSAKQLKDAGFSAAQLRAAGFTAAQLKNAGFSAAALKKAGYSAAALKNAGFSAAQLKAAGFSAAALKQAGFSAQQLRNAGFSAKALKNAGFSASQLKAAGYGAGQLAAAGFTAKQLENAGFSAKALRAAGFTAAQLKQAGYTAKELKNAGYSDGDLLRAGFTPKQSGYASAKAAKHAVAKQKAVSSGKNFNDKLDGNGASIPAANSQEARMANLIRQEQARMSAQQRQDSIQQLSGAMSMQANRMVAEWSNNQTQTMQKATPPTSKTNDGAAGANASGSSAQLPGTILKAGSVMFAILDTSIDTDEKSPIMATIVDGPLKGSKLLGQFTRVNKRVLLHFNLLNDPHYYKSISLNAVAIDPNTARTAISGKVNNHYLLKYGTVFATAFLSGLSNAVLQSNSSPQCSLFGCVNNVSSLNTRQQVTVGLGTAGEQIATDYSSKFNNMPPTIKIKGGTGIGILIMSDLKLPVGAVPSKDDGSNG